METYSETSLDEAPEVTLPDSVEHGTVTTTSVISVVVYVLSEPMSVQEVVMTISVV